MMSEISIYEPKKKKIKFVVPHHIRFLECSFMLYIIDNMVYVTIWTHICQQSTANEYRSYFYCEFELFFLCF